MTDSFRPIRPDVAGLRPVGRLLLHVEWYESEREGGAADPVLLLSEAEAPSTRWPDPLIARLVETVGPVLRFDTRDSGRSESDDQPFTLDWPPMPSRCCAVLAPIGRMWSVDRWVGWSPNSWRSTTPTPFGP